MKTSQTAKYFDNYFDQLRVGWFKGIHKYEMNALTGNAQNQIFVFREIIERKA
jgi:hypothetical protein